jgi:DNA invertase Pin-like site-specific DNA recombinase
MKVALYARVSKDEDQKDARYQDPEYQLQSMREFCKFKGFEIVEEYVDKASGADPNRENFKKVLKEGYLKGYKGIIVWKLDRFSREPLFVTLSYIEHLKVQGTALISITESWLDTRIENPMSDLVLAIMSWASSEERRKISERTKAGIKRLKAIGQWKGGRPFKKQRGGGVTIEDKKLIKQTSV